MESVIEFLSQCPASMVNKIYGKDMKKSNESIWACKAVFQSLSTLSKHLIFRLLFVNSAIPVSVISNWIEPVAGDELMKALTEMAKLRILDHSDTTSFKVHDDDNLEMESNSWKFIRLNATFCENMRRSLVESSEPPAASLTSAIDVQKYAPTDIRDIDMFSNDRWDDVLKFLIDVPIDTKGSEKSTKYASIPDVRSSIVVQNFFISSELMMWERKKLIITAAGYDYMLKDKMSQVWAFVFAAISALESQEEALSWLFMLSYCKYGSAYALADLQPMQQQLVRDFVQVGIVFMTSSSSPVYYPTRIAINMLFHEQTSADVEVNDPSMSVDTDGNQLIRGKPNVSVQRTHDNGDANNVVDFGRSSMSAHFYVIVETNSQVVAYVSSDLHLAMLRLFVDITVRMPNMAMGRVTRERAKAAYRIGIRAEQIIDFLASHAHPIVSNRTDGLPVIPENVTDQLKLWEAENFRLVTDDAALYVLDQPGITPASFKDTVNYMKRVGALLWADEKSKTIVVTHEAKEQLQSFVAETMQANVTVLY